MWWRWMGMGGRSQSYDACVRSGDCAMYVPMLRPDLRKRYGMVLRTAMMPIPAELKFITIRREVVLDPI